MDFVFGLLIGSCLALASWLVGWWLRNRPERCLPAIVGQSRIRADWQPVKRDQNALDQIPSWGRAIVLSVSDFRSQGWVIYETFDEDGRVTKHSMEKSSFITRYPLVDPRCSRT